MYFKIVKLMIICNELKQIISTSSGIKLLLWYQSQSWNIVPAKTPSLQWTPTYFIGCENLTYTF